MAFRVDHPAAAQQRLLAWKTILQTHARSFESRTADIYGERDLFSSTVGS